MAERLILWDLDGTLLWARGASRLFDEAIARVLGQPGPRVAKGGKTDPQIVREVLVAAAVPDHEVDERLASALAYYVDAVVAGGGALHADSELLPGVATLLPRLAGEPGFLQTVLTGNVEPGARAKVALFGLDRWLDLDVGAYGSDDHDRRALVPVAVGRAERLRGRHFRPGQVWVVGDTPNDLACARAAGARCLLVASGAVPAGELAGLGADALVADLADVDRIGAILLG